jgi:hypothetical protein
MNQEQSVRDGTSQKTASPEQQSDILLLANTEKKSIRVASDEAGKTDRLDKINQENPPFLKIDKNSIMENFLSNYFRQSKDPTYFRFFRVPLLEAKDAAPHLRDLFKEKPSKENQDFARKYEVKPLSQAQKNDSNQSKESNHQLKNQKMDTGQETKTQTAPAVNASGQRFNEAMINWEQLAQFGISRDYLQRAQLLDEMLKGYKTSKLVPVKCNFGSATLATDARLSFRQMQDGQVALAMHGIRKEPELNKPFYGHIFSEEDKQNLKETGNMGRQAFLSYRGSEEKVPCLISIDKLTNEIVPCRAENVFIPKEVCGVALTEFEQNDLREGKKIFVDGMISKKGNEFDCHLQINAERRGIEYLFDNDGQFNRKSIGGVPLTDKQIETLNEGKTIFLEDMTSKNGQPFSSFIKLDENKNPQYTRYNPDSPEGAREIYIPKVINGVEITKDEDAMLRRGTPIFLKDMVSRSGEEYSSFVKVDTETGRMSTSKTLEGFDEKPSFKVPDEIWGVKLKATEKARLQDGKAVEITGMKGFEGKEFSSWVRVNQNQGKLDFFTENPDKPRHSASTAQTNQQESSRQSEKRAQKEEKPKKKSSKITV